MSTNSMSFSTELNNTTTASQRGGSRSQRKNKLLLPKIDPTKLTATAPLESTNTVSYTNHFTQTFSDDLFDMRALNREINNSYQPNFIYTQNDQYEHQMGQFQHQHQHQHQGQPSLVPGSFSSLEQSQGQDLMSTFTNHPHLQSEQQQQFVRSEDEANEIYNMINDLPKLSPGSEFSLDSATQDDGLRMDIDNDNDNNINNIDDRESITLQSLLDDDPLFAFGKPLERQESNETILQSSSPMNGDDFHDDEVLRKDDNNNNNNNGFASSSYNASVEQLLRMNQMSISSSAASISSEGPKQSTFYNNPVKSTSGLELAVAPSTTTKARKHPKAQTQRTKSQTKPKPKPKPRQQQQQQLPQLPQQQQQQQQQEQEQEQEPPQLQPPHEKFASEPPLVFPPQQPIFQIVQPPPPPIQFQNNSQLPLSIQLRHSQSRQALKRESTPDSAPSSTSRSRSSSVSRPLRAAPPQQQRYSSLIIESPTSAAAASTASTTSGAAKARRSVSSSSTPQTTRLPPVSRSSSSLSLNKVNKIQPSYSSLSTNLTTSFATVKKSKSYLHRNPDSFYQTLDFSKNISRWNNKMQSDRISANGSDMLTSKFALESNPTKSFQFVIEDGLKAYNERSSSTHSGFRKTNASSSSLPADIHQPSPYDHHHHRLCSSSVAVSNASGTYQPNRGPFNRPSSAASSISSARSYSSFQTKPAPPKKKDTRQVPEYKYQSIIYPTPVVASAATSAPPQTTFYIETPTTQAKKGNNNNNSNSNSNSNISNHVSPEFIPFQDRSATTNNTDNMVGSGYDSSPNTSHSPASSSLRAKRKNSDCSSSVSPVSSKWSTTY